MIEESGFKNIDEYIAQFKPETQEILHKLRKVIHETVPEAGEKISYQMPTFTLNGNLVHFAAYQNHIGFYPTPSAILAFSKEISGYKSSKGAVQFPIADPLPYELIREIVKFRTAENMKIGERKGDCNGVHKGK
jgi:uncharacterized protein YdhG (YjbR/CyaY superfamily)